MAIKKYNPTSNGRRHMSSLDYNANLSGHKPEKSLLRNLKKHAGRNNTGKITVRNRTGGAKRKYRIIDFKRKKDDIVATVKTIEYDPNRSANISLLVYKDGFKAYILSPRGIKIGQEVISGINADIKTGNTLPLFKIPDGTVVHNIEMQPGAGGKIARSAGQSAQIVAQSSNDKYTTIKLKSGEVRKILSKCRATIGEIGNEEHSLVTFGRLPL